MQSSRKEMITAMDGAEKGKNYWLESVSLISNVKVYQRRLTCRHLQQHYYKAEAYRVEPLSSNSYLSVDGEPYPFEPFQVEVHKGLATLLSPYGAYNVDFGETPTTKLTRS